MAFSPQTVAKIIKRFEELAPGAKCPLCGNEDWLLSDGIVFLVFQDKYPMIKLSGQGLPLAAITCTKCGNTHMINLIHIGLGDVLGEIREAQEEKK